MCGKTHTKKKHSTYWDWNQKHALSLISIRATLFMFNQFYGFRQAKVNKVKTQNTAPCKNKKKNISSSLPPPLAHTHTHTHTCGKVLWSGNQQLRATTPASFCWQVRAVYSDRAPPWGNTKKRKKALLSIVSFKNWCS